MDTLNRGQAPFPAEIWKAIDEAAAQASRDRLTGFRLYPGTEMIGLEHLRRLCTAGIYKAAIEGGVLVDPRVGVLILGQDLYTGYSSQDGIHYHLYVSESIVLRIDDPKAICVIPATAGALRHFVDRHQRAIGTGLWFEI